MNHVAVLEVGGSHAVASWVDLGALAVEFPPGTRLPLDPHGTASEILDVLGRCVRQLGALDGAPLAVAIPGPFDYASGLGRFHGVGKFDSLNGVDVGAGIRQRLVDPPSRLSFVNDAAAFGIGAWVLSGGGRDRQRLVAITLGSGVGSAFVCRGELVSDGPRVPPHGHVHLLQIDGDPLESVVSSRAILARYRGGGGSADDVQHIAERACAGEQAALEAFTDPLRELGEALAPWLARFGAQLLVIGGAMSGSWPLVEPALRAGLGGTSMADVPIEKAAHPDAATALGAACAALPGALSRIAAGRSEPR